MSGYTGPAESQLHQAVIEFRILVAKLDLPVVTRKNLLLKFENIIDHMECGLSDTYTESNNIHINDIRKLISSTKQ
jgi:hypothetical protein